MPANPIRNAFEQYLPPPTTGTGIINARLLPRMKILPNPWQPRRHGDRERLRELADDIAVRGILEPLLVRPNGDHFYQVIAGERRYQASVLAGLAELPCIILENLTEDAAREIALVENLQREDLDIEDEGQALLALHNGGLSLRDIAARIHKSHQYVQRRLRLVADPEALVAYRAGQLNLDDLVTDRPGRTAADVPMSDLAQAAQEADPTSPGTDESVTERYKTAGPPTPFVFDEASSRRIAVTYKPFHVFKLHIRRFHPETVPAEEKLELRRTVGELIDELTAIANRLDAGEED